MFLFEKTKKFIMSSLSSSPDFSRPSPKNGYYDVFLSFRGTDTRFAFTNSLYHSLMDKEVYTFMDRDLVGKPIDSLFEIIRRSKMAVVVYSEGFAASDRCLRELDMILQRVKGKDMLILPIFYKVQVGELKHLNGETAKYLDAHIQEHGETTVLKWKDAITALGKVSGSSYNEDSYERDFIVDVINIIKRRLEKEWEETCCIPPKSNPKDVMEQECPTFKITWEGTEEEQEEMIWPTTVDVHPTKPWVLLISHGRMRIWNYETRALEFKYDDMSANFNHAKFIPEKHWIVATEDGKFVLVLDYNTSKKLKTFKAHMGVVDMRGLIVCVVVHPTLPYVLTACFDGLIKLWNWEDDWVCQQTFVGYPDGVRHVAFNPRDPHSFACVSEHFLEIWRIDSRVAEFISPKSAKCIYHVDYFVGNGDMLYIFSGYDIWHCGSKTLVQTLKPDVRHEITTVLVHPKLPVILTAGSEKGEKGRFCIWNKNTYQLLQVCDCIKFGWIEFFRFIEASEEVLIGCQNGLFLVKFAFPGKQSA